MGSLGLAPVEGLSPADIRWLDLSLGSTQRAVYVSFLSVQGSPF